MDIASAQHLVTGTEDSLRKCARDFEGVKRAADDFVEWANGILEKLQDSDAEVQKTQEATRGLIYKMLRRNHSKFVLRSFRKSA